MGNFDENGVVRSGIDGITFQPGGVAQRPEPLWSPLYRYFFFDWLFSDVDRGSFMERAAAWRSNREMRKHLPTYLRRWLFVFFCGYGLGLVFENGFAQVSPAAGC